MKRIRCVLFTAASCAGKSTIAKSLQADGIPVLDNDHEVMSRSFEILAKGQRLHERINPVSSWQHLRQTPYDFDRLFRLHHRDWFARSEMPHGFVAVGWIYSFRDWRQQVVNAFNQFHHLRFEYRLAMLKLSYDAFFERYSNAIRQRFGTSHAFFSKSKEQQRAHSDKHYRDFHDNHWQEPLSSENIDCYLAHDDASLRARIDEWLLV